MSLWMHSPWGHRTKVYEKAQSVVGEVRKGTVRLEETVLPLGLRAGFEAKGILVNEQDFTKTANIWGVANNTHGTNSNRIVVFEKP